MKLNVFKALWGLEGSYELLLERAANAGYAGVEAPMPSREDEAGFKEALKRHGLSYIIQTFTYGDHAGSFEEQVERAASFEPVLIVCHSAKDSMSESDQDRFYEKALRIEQKAGIRVGHETHRGRAMFTPWTTARLLNKFPELRITADFSHWVNVCESYLEDQQEAIGLAIERAIHVHGRIGFPEGPQVPHPASPYFEKELGLFLQWWERIFAAQTKSGKEQTTFTAEFGPPGYMPTDPFTNKPISDLWEVNEWMTECLKKKYVQWMG
ncbi:sugar phosphate isomerase/epimerase [Paenibacillus sp. PAMC21692]|uniref:sugar phosphate isomerase/epimerase family protein n=1 Tax=Paenibacillus sp. PAMC21692 TaxID=2762320 RepID=UPI00164EC847|nr:TIM barrel protein [Paenibacillus sp. PAMC21692]QNK60180.1 sugar phosphate isomerase/epimerase [Paenibacillus sp. PAMC21692]